jgi:hypothetical protein
MRITVCWTGQLQGNREGKGRQGPRSKSAPDPVIGSLAYALDEKREFRRKAAGRIGAHCEAVRLCLDAKALNTKVTAVNRHTAQGFEPTGSRS